MKTIIRFSLTLLLSASFLLVNVACNTTSSVQSVAKDGADFSRYGSYAFTERDKAAVIPGVNPAELLWAQEIVELEMARRGFSPVPEAQADILVSIESEVTGSREKGGFSLGFGTGNYSRSGGGSVGVSTGPIGAGQVPQSTLTIRLVEPQSKDLLWVGWIDKLENNKFSQQEFKDKIREIMARFPAR